LPIAYSISFASALTSLIICLLARSVASPTARSIVARYYRSRFTLVEELAHLLEIRARHALVQVADKCASSRPYQPADQPRRY
jgi:hypothetical protein